LTETGGFSRSSGTFGFPSDAHLKDERGHAWRRRLSPGVDYRFNQYSSPITHKSRTTVLLKYYRRAPLRAMKISSRTRFFREEKFAEKTGDSRDFFLDCAVFSN
jgi:hypothetical protein